MVGGDVSAREREVSPLAVIDGTSVPGGVHGGIRRVVLDEAIRDIGLAVVADAGTVMPLQGHVLLDDAAGDREASVLCVIDAVAIACAGVAADPSRHDRKAAVVLDAALSSRHATGIRAAAVAKRTGRARPESECPARSSVSVLAEISSVLARTMSAASLISVEVEPSETAARSSSSVETEVGAARAGLGNRAAAKARATARSAALPANPMRLLASMMGPSRPILRDRPTPPRAGPHVTAGARMARTSADMLSITPLPQAHRPRPQRAACRRRQGPHRRDRVRPGAPTRGQRCPEASSDVRRRSRGRCP